MELITEFSSPIRNKKDELCHRHISINFQLNFNITLITYEEFFLLYNYLIEKYNLLGLKKKFLNKLKWNIVFKR